MTRNERPGSGLYDEDFYRWTQQQAAALRALPPAAVDLAPGIAPLDAAHLAEEIEDLGKRDLREVVSHLRLVIQHLVKLRAAPASRDAAHWHTEAVNFQIAAREAFSPSMRRLIDVGDIWIGGCRAAGRFLKDAGARDPSADPCPFTLDDLLAPDFDVDAAAGRIATD